MDAMIRVEVTFEAFDAVVAMVPVDSVAFEPGIFMRQR
jgi:hypothetical protein